MTLDFNETPEPKDVKELWERLCRLVRSMPDWTFREDVTLTASASGERIAHGGRSAPMRVFAEISSTASAAPVLQVGAKDKTHVTIISSANTVANLGFMF